MTKNLNHAEVELEYTIPAEDDGKAVITTLEVSRPKTRHIITLSVVFGPDIAQFIASSDGNTAKEKLAKLQESDDIGQLLTSLVSKEKIDAMLELLADLCGITADQAGEIDLVDQVTIFKKLAGFFPVLKSLFEDKKKTKAKAKGRAKIEVAPST